MAKAICLDCGKVQIDGDDTEVIHGLCEECYQKWLERDPGLTKWAFKEGGD